MAIRIFSNLTQRERMMIGACLIVLLLAVANYWVVLPIRARFKALAHDIEAAGIEIKANKRILAYEGDVEQRFQEFGNRMDVAKDGLDASAELLTEVEGLATRCGINMIDRKAQGVEPKGYFEEHVVKVEVEGGIADLMNLLHGLESSGQLLRVRKIDLSPEVSGQGQRIKGSIIITKMISV